MYILRQRIGNRLKYEEFVSSDCESKTRMQLMSTQTHTYESDLFSLYDINKLLLDNSPASRTPLGLHEISTFASETARDDAFYFRSGRLKERYANGVGGYSYRNRCGYYDADGANSYVSWDDSEARALHTYTCEN